MLCRFIRFYVAAMSAAAAAARHAIALPRFYFFFCAMPLRCHSLFSGYAFDAAMLLMPAPPDAIAIISLLPPFLHAIISLPPPFRHASHCFTLRASPLMPPISADFLTLR
jgi:hypothetical protein